MPPEKLLKTMVRTGMHVAKKTNNLIKNGWKSLWGSKNTQVSSKLDSKNVTKLVTMEQEQNTIMARITESIDHAKKIKRQLEKTTKEINCGFDSEANDKFTQTLKNYGQISTEIQLKEKKAGEALLVQVIWVLEDMLLDCIQAGKKITDCFLEHDRLVKELESSAGNEVEFRVNYQLENERILNKEIAHFSKLTDENVKEVLRAFVELCLEIR